jgi:HEXXH motif-containing protein
VRLEEGLALLRRSLAPLDQEFRAIIRRIIIIGSDPSKPFDVDGGSHYQLWGALFLNGEHHPDALGVAEVLAHESAHSLLFGFCMDEPLVENRDEELYASPLRADLRPMDGIYHATFVSARMHWAMSQLAGDPGLSAADRARAAAAAATDRENFEAGYGVVAEHGRLTPLGRTLMERARSYMDAAPSPGG